MKVALKHGHSGNPSIFIDLLRRIKVATVTSPGESSRVTTVVAAEQEDLLKRLGVPPLKSTSWPIEVSNFGFRVGSRVQLPFLGLYKLCEESC